MTNPEFPQGQVVTLIGDPTKPGKYAQLLKVAPRVSIQSHHHAGDRTATDVRTLHLGPETVLVTLVLSDGVADAAARRRLREIEQCLRAVDERLRYVFCRFNQIGASDA